MAATTKGVGCYGQTTGLSYQDIDFQDLAANPQGDPLPDNYHCLLWLGGAWTISHTVNGATTDTSAAVNTGGSQVDFPYINKPFGTMVVDSVDMRRGGICNTSPAPVWFNGTLNGVQVFAYSASTLTTFSTFNPPAMEVDTLVIDVRPSFCPLFRIDNLVIRDAAATTVRQTTMAQTTTQGVTTRSVTTSAVTTVGVTTRRHGGP